MFAADCAMVDVRPGACGTHGFPLAVSLAANGFLTCGLGVVAIIVLPRDPSAANINEREEGLLADDRGKYRSTP
ncbi:MAG TPA: hypothetical protein DCK98_12260 [Chloroflexi bacterium]|nr:hypothetical protein [Chloroflexota bacterium]